MQVLSPSPSFLPPPHNTSFLIGEDNRIFRPPQVRGGRESGREGPPGIKAVS